MLKKLKKFLLFLLLLVLLVGLILLGMAHWKWSPQTGVALLTGYLLVVIGFLFFKRLLLWTKVEKFVRKTLAQDRTAAKLPAVESPQLKDLQQNWKVALEKLKTSDLRKKGDPLYALPWFLMLGETGSGKSTTLQTANLSRPLLEVSPTPSLGGIKNCDWWFSDEAIILDTSGRYVSSSNKSDEEEWESFLVLLAKARKKESLSGLIVAVPAATFHDLDDKTIQQRGEALRQRLNQIMRALGNKFPVYVVATKVDQLLGLAQFSKSLPEETLTQALGFSNENLSAPWEETLSRAQNTLSLRLRNLRLMLLYQNRMSETESHLFPTEIARIQPSLRVFIKALFEENPYQETPLFRGLYFLGAPLKPESNLRSVTLFGQEPEKGPVAKNGYFLVDFFKSILPADRYLFQPLAAMASWRNLTKNLGFITWVLFWVFLSSLLTFSFFKNLSCKKVATQCVPPGLSSDMSDNISNLDKFRLSILRLESANRWGLQPRIGLNQSRQWEKEVKAKYSHLVGTQFVDTLYADIYAQIKSADSARSDLMLDTYERYDQQRTNLKEKQNDKNYLSAFQGACTGLLRSTLKIENAEQFGAVYISFVQWTDNESLLQNIYSSQQDRLTKLIYNRDLSYFTRPTKLLDKAIKLPDFWGPNRPAGKQDSILVWGAYTRLGKKELEIIAAQHEKNSPDPGSEKAKNRRFWNQYPIGHSAVWRDFITHLSALRPPSEDPETAQQVAKLITSPQNPYFKLLDTLDVEFEEIVKEGKTPHWVNQALELSAIQELAKKEAGWLGKIKDASQELENQFTQKKKYITAWNNYVSLLANLAPLTKNEDDCFALISAEMSQKSTLLDTCYKSFVTYQTLMSPTGSAEDSIIWGLIYAPFKYMVQYGFDVSKRYLKNAWDEKVQRPTVGMSPEEKAAKIFDPEGGLIWKFLDETAKPFLKKGADDSYQPKQLFGLTFPLKASFVQSLNPGQGGGVAQDEYRIELECKPLVCNPEVQVQNKPNRYMLEVPLPDGQTARIEFASWAVKETFIWKPETNGPVTLTIFVGNNIPLVYKYNGLPEFLKDFQSRFKRFYRSDFSSRDLPILDKLKIIWIEVSYNFGGDWQKVIKAKAGASRAIPADPTE